MNNDRTQTRNRVTASLLLLCFLFQPVIVYFASPWIETESDTGSAMVACTLKHEMMSHRSDDSSMVAQLDNDEYCPAIKLLDMANAIVHVELPVFTTTVYATPYAAFTRQVLEAYGYRAYTIRAPPVFS